MTLTVAVGRERPTVCVSDRGGHGDSYLSTATKWGLDKLDALRRLFTGNAWLPPGLEPA